MILARGMPENVMLIEDKAANTQQNVTSLGTNSRTSASMTYFQSGLKACREQVTSVAGPGHACKIPKRS
jgi:hypothetical protein